MLNGLEIFKLSDSKRSFAASNPELKIDPPSKSVEVKKKARVVIYSVVGSVIGVVAVFAAVIFLILRRQRNVKDAATRSRTSRSGVSLPSDICRYFSIDEIKTATWNFDDNFVIGRGGYGNVYKGLIDPEYYRTQQLTLKSDVYSFGVVMFEVLCGRPPIIATLPMEQANLAEWAKFCCKKGTVDKIIDSNLKGQIAPECFRNFVEISLACLRDKGIDRPSMNDIVWKLEFAIQLQVSAEGRGEGKDDGFTAMSPSLPLLGIGSSNTFSRSRSSEFSTNSSECPVDDFSELVNPLGR